MQPAWIHLSCDAQVPEKAMNSWVVGPPQTSCHAACEAYALGCSVRQMQNITSAGSFINLVGTAFPGYVASCVFAFGTQLPVSCGCCALPAGSHDLQAYKNADAYHATAGVSWLWGRAMLQHRPEERLQCSVIHQPLMVSCSFTSTPLHLVAEFWL